MFHHSSLSRGRSLTKFECILFQVAKHKDPRDACAAIVAESYRLWLQYETRTDDITIIVVHIDGLKDVKKAFGC